MMEENPRNMRFPQAIPCWDSKDKLLSNGKFELLSKE